MLVTNMTRLQYTVVFGTAKLTTDRLVMGAISIESSVPSTSLPPYFNFVLAAADPGKITFYLALVVVAILLDGPRAGLADSSFAILFPSSTFNCSNSRRHRPIARQVSSAWLREINQSNDETQRTILYYTHPPTHTDRSINQDDGRQRQRFQK